MNLIYLVAVGISDPRYYEAIQWCAHSLRHWGKFDGEILVITDNASHDLMQATGQHVELLEVDSNAMFVAAHHRADHDKYLIARLMVYQLIDLDRYETIMYVDTDVLAINDIKPLFWGVNEFRYSREFQLMSAPMFSYILTAEELEQARWRRAINSGVFVAPAKTLANSLNIWKEIIDRHPKGSCYDQAALNAAVIRNAFASKPLPSYSVAYPILANFKAHYRTSTQLLHYCGSRTTKFLRMQRDYETLLANEPLKMNFKIQASQGDLSRNADVQRPWVLGKNRERWVIAIDERNGIESHALVNNRYACELEARGHNVISLAESTSKQPDVVIHHNYTKDFLSMDDFVHGVPHIAVRTSDFGPHPSAWVDMINNNYEQLWVHSYWTQDNARMGGVEEKRIKVVPHGVDTDVFTPVGEKYELPTKKSFRFLFVGGAAIRKGIDILLEAYISEFSNDDDVCLVIKDSSSNVFYTNDAYRNKIVEMQSGSSLPEVIHLDSHLSCEDLAALYRTCSVGVWPYRGEGFLMPALESLACGTPTMLPEIGPTRDYSDERTSFLVPTINVQLPIEKSFRMRLGFEIDVQSVNLCEIKPAVLAKFMRRAFETSAEGHGDKRAAAIAKAHGEFTWAYTTDIVERHIYELLHSMRTKSA